MACLTIRIRNLQKHNAEKRHDVSNRHRLKEMIDRRKSLLKHLRRMDYKRFEWLLEKLDLVYHANVQYGADEHLAVYFVTYHSYSSASGPSRR